MERFDFSSLNNALGIHKPWLIKSVDADKEQAQVFVHLETPDKKRRFSLFETKDTNSDLDLIEGSWLYQPIGSFRSIIQAHTKPMRSDIAISHSLLTLPAFVGHPDRKYSNYLRQQVALSQQKGLDKSTISSTLQIDEQLVEQILTDIRRSAPKTRCLVYLPTEIDPVWGKIISSELDIRTESLPLKLLLKKIKTLPKTNVDTDHLQSINQLRHFFMANAYILNNEIDQLCGIHYKKTKGAPTRRDAKVTLILPSLKSPLWLHVLSGKLKLQSLSVALNLLISRQQVAFLSSKTTKEKLQAINTLRKYFHKHYRSLKSELLLINNALKKPEQNQWRLPEPNHAIWYRIIQDKNFLSSEHIAYKMLLATLRSQISLSKDPNIKIEASQRIRGFLQKNQKTMRNEINTILLDFSPSTKPVANF